MRETVVIALGGNAILQPGQAGELSEQTANIRIACNQIAVIIARGYRVVLSHGNGPQVGNILIQNEVARNRVPAMPLDVLGAQSQGELGYLLQRELQQALSKRGVTSPVVSLVTQVIVDGDDPAFRNPVKPVGPFYSEAEAKGFIAAGFGPMAEDAGRGWRRVVPSPAPVRIVELEPIRSLVEGGYVVIACGGGGIPVVEGPDGFVGVEAVIDKDLAAQRLASELGANVLLLLTGVPKVYLHYGTANQHSLDRLTPDEALHYLEAGHFPAGSMRAKVESAVQFVHAGGDRAIITSLETAVSAMDGLEGTHIVPANAVSAADSSGKKR